MTYVITEPCIDVKDKTCTDVCPMDCIHGTASDEMLYIDPEECIDCGACVPVCPVKAIFAEGDHLFGQRFNLFCFRVRCLDFFMLQERSYHISEHGLSMA